MDKINLISKKYDGSLRDTAEAFLIARDEETVVLLQPPGTPEYVYRRQRWETAPDGLLMLFFTNRWYNVWHIADQHSHLNHIYANIARPARWVDSSTLEWVDLDLDIRVHLDGSIVLLDEEEFLENQLRMGYPPDVVTQARSATQEALDLCQQGCYPFDHAIQVARYFATLGG
jgi:protein associated with RNAse G/E